jgi:cell division septation protein DedD
MERRLYERIAVNLNVALLDDRAMPRGCRVRDISQGGMLLQFEHPSGTNPYNDGDSVKVRVSLKEGNDRTVLLLPATVRHSHEKGLGVAFVKPAAELMQLLEPYQLDKRGVAEAAVSATAAASQVAMAGTPTPGLERPAQRRYRSTPDTRARLARRITAIREAIARAGEQSAERPGQAAAGRRDRRTLQLGLASLAVAVAIAVFNLATQSSTSRRLSALEKATSQHAETLAGVQIRLTADKQQENQVAELRTRVNELAVAVAALETGQLAPAAGNVAAGTLPATSPPQPEQDAEEHPLKISPTAAAAPDRGAAAVANGPWVLNLVSLYDQTAAEQFAAKARTAGIPVVQNQAQVKGKPVWRLQVSGFASREAASHYADANKHKLGVKNVWIFKR